MAVSTVKLNGTTLMTVNDTTATAADVAGSKYFYAADGTKTLGTGSGGGQTATGTITGNDTTTVSFSVPFEPDLVCLYRNDINSMTAISDRSIGITAIAKDMFMFYNAVAADATVTSGNIVTTATGTASTTRSSLNYFTYENGTVTYRCNQGNASYFRSSLQYSYKCIKWT